jgi:hypothetical protein
MPISNEADTAVITVVIILFPIMNAAFSYAFFYLSSRANLEKREKSLKKYDKMDFLQSFWLLFAYIMFFNILSFSMLIITDINVLFIAYFGFIMIITTLYLMLFLLKLRGKLFWVCFISMLLTNVFTLGMILIIKYA